MKSTKITINHPSGLHARPTTQFVAEASKFNSEITLTNHLNRSANGKSIMAILGLGVTGQTEIELSANGPDEDQALNALKLLLETELVK